MKVSRVEFIIEPSCIGRDVIEATCTVRSVGNPTVSERVIIRQTDFPAMLSVYLKIACKLIEDYFASQQAEEAKTATIVEGLRAHGESFILGEMDKRKQE